MILRSILLKNFKSIGNEGGAGITIPLARINYIIGPNGAGKSNIIDGLETIAAILAGGKYEPKPADHFDRDPARDLELGATVELSNEERLRLLGALVTVPAGVSAEDFSRFFVFRFVNYSVTFGNGEKQTEKISVSMRDDIFHTVLEAYRGEKSIEIKLGLLKMSDQKDRLMVTPSSNKAAQFPSTHELLGQVGPFLLKALREYFRGFHMLNTGRKIAASVPAREAQGVSPDGANLPAELSCLDRDRQVEFDKYMEAITHGDPMGLEPRPRGSEFVLRMKEAGLGSRGTHADLGSGQEQSLILGWHMFNASGTILVVREPELHLHAERQKQILRLIRQADPGLQFVIETHSPVFLGTAKDETVLLATKSEGSTRVAKIAPESMRVIREELGISHADALYNANVVFVEGASELGAFPMLWKKVCPDSAVTLSWFSLGGAGNTMHLRMMLEYLKGDGRRFFVILDGHDDARMHVEALQKAGLLGEDNCWFLAESFEDEFDGCQIAWAVSMMAADAGFELSLDPGEIDAVGSGKAVVNMLKKRWREATGTVFQKHLLALHLGKLSDDEISFGLGAALQAVDAYFKPSADSRDAGGGVACCASSRPTCRICAPSGCALALDGLASIVVPNGPSKSILIGGGEPI